MQYLIHNTRTFLTGSAAAGAVMRYRTSLQLVLGTDSVDLPAIDLDGTATRVRLRISPRTRLRSVWAEDDELESDDRVFVNALRDRAALL
ncbi:hypothetical protein BIU98_01935 [Curtobacterium sp. MMLR14_010]|uniref:hypothetical protein n=1 Tax=Curtobacterium sp. MMLR14_010 TaxID=1898743 RepID=UPI0008DCCED5|nr:hypothetical protein [Curtobacterium sp. MMLR14_010]OII34751.1 hypothetical protein BIU98_01935 [Curtobacterium sp. MMLR14_010]